MGESIKEPARQIGGATASNWGAPLFVWGIWAALLLAALAFVWRYGRNIPFFDEWTLVPTVTGEAPVTAAWLWEPHNEHRIPLPKLIQVGLLRLTGDFRTEMFLNVLALGAVAWVLLRVARKLRGETTYADALLPLALLHLGHGWDLLWGFEVQFISSTMLAGCLLGIIAGAGASVRPWPAIGAGICLVLLPLCGANGLALVPVLAFWLVYQGVRLLRSTERPSHRISGVLVLGLAVTALMLVASYFLGPGALSGTPRPGLPALGRVLRRFALLAASSFGPVVMAFHPVSTFGAVGLFIGSAALLVYATWRGSQPERARALGLLSFLGANAGLLGAVAWGRDDHHVMEYNTLAAPALCAVYFSWVLYSPRRLEGFLPMCLFTLLCAMLSLNTRSGLDVGISRRNAMEAVEQDLRDGVPISLLIKCHAEDLLPGRMYESRRVANDVLESSLQSLRRAGFGSFRFLSDGPPLQEVTLPAEPCHVDQVTRREDGGWEVGPNSNLVFALPEPRFVVGIRIRYRLAKGQGNSAYLQTFWKRSDQEAFTDPGAEGPNERFHESRTVEAGPGEKVLTVWVWDAIDQFRIHPDNQPCTFQISEIRLLVPATKDHEAAAIEKARTVGHRRAAAMDD